MTSTKLPDSLFDSDDHPLHWQGKHVYIRTLQEIGFVSASYQNGKPSQATITVSLVDENGRWSNNGPRVEYAMPEAMVDLVPEINCLIIEEP